MTDDPIPLEEAQRREAEAGSAPEPMTDAPPPAGEADYGAQPPESLATFDVQRDEPAAPNGSPVDPAECTTPGEPQRRFKGIWANDMKPVLTRRDLIKGLIPKNALTVIWGPPSCGKSFMTLDAAIYIAIDRDYQGRRTVQGPMVYISGEGGKQINNRVEAWRRHNAEADIDIPLLCYDAAPVLPDDTQDLIACIRHDLDGATPAGVTIDTVNKVILGSTSNDDDMRGLVRGLRTIIAELDSAVLALHHCGWDTAHMSGSRVLQADADCELAVSESNGIRTVKHMKMRDGGLTEPFNFELVQIELGTDEDGDPINSCAVEQVTAPPRREVGSKLTANQGTMLSLLDDFGQGGATVEEWNTAARQQGLGKRNASLYDFRKALKDKKRVHTTNDRWYVTKL